MELIKLVIQARVSIDKLPEVCNTRLLHVDDKISVNRKCMIPISAPCSSAGASAAGTHTLYIGLNEITFRAQQHHSSAKISLSPTTLLSLSQE